MQHILFTGQDGHITTFTGLLNEFFKFYIKNLSLDLYLYIIDLKNILFNSY
jgi:hypothetical protein